MRTGPFDCSRRWPERRRMTWEKPDVEQPNDNSAVAVECIHYWHALRRMGFIDKNVNFAVETDQIVIDVRVEHPDRALRFVAGQFQGPARLFLGELSTHLSSYVNDPVPYVLHFPRSRAFDLFTSLLDKFLDKGFEIFPKSL